MPSTDSTSTSLLSRVATLDPEAWQRFVDLYGPLVYEWCRVCGLQPNDAADVAQETFLAVVSKISGFRRERPGDSFRGWLWTVTRNKIRDHFRRLQSIPHGQGGTAAQRQLEQVPDLAANERQTAPIVADPGGLERRALEIVRAGVEDRTWEAFWRASVEGQSAKEVAEELGMSAQAVYDANYRIRRRVRRELGELID